MRRTCEKNLGKIFGNISIRFHFKFLKKKKKRRRKSFQNILEKCLEAFLENWLEKSCKCPIRISGGTAREQFPNDLLVISRGTLLRFPKNASQGTAFFKYQKISQINSRGWFLNKCFNFENNFRTIELFFCFLEIF